MTTIVVVGNVMAADSRVTVTTEDGGTRMFRCQKIYRKKVGRREVLIGTAGQAAPSMLFVEWLGSGRPRPDILVNGDADFSCLVLYRDGSMFEYDAWCQPERILEPFYAIGSGAKAALGALHAMQKRDARKACAIACKIDPCSGPPITVHTFD